MQLDVRAYNEPPLSFIFSLVTKYQTPKRCVSVDYIIIPALRSGLEKLGEAESFKPHCSFEYQMA